MNDIYQNIIKASVERVSLPNPLKRNDIKTIVDTAKAGELLRMKLIYPEAGSGETHAIESDIISKVKGELKIPFVIGGGIRTKMELESAYNAGADLVIIGTALEEDEAFVERIKKRISE